MDLGNYELGKNNYEYSPADPQNSKLKGLMTTDYNQLKTDLQTPGDLQINQTFDKGDNRNRDIMGGNGMYGSSIYGDTINQSTLNRSNALAANSANAGATVANLKSNENQWLGSAALDEASLKNTWNMGQDTMNKDLIQNLIMADLNNGFQMDSLDKQGEWGLKNIDAQGKWGLKNIDTQGGWNMNTAQYNAGAANDAAKSNAWGSLGGAALGGLMSNFGDITSTVGSWF